MLMGLVGTLGGQAADVMDRDVVSEAWQVGRKTVSFEWLKRSGIWGVSYNEGRGECTTWSRVD